MSKRKRADQAEMSSGSSPCRDYCVVIHSGKHKPFAELLCRDLQARGCPAYFDMDSNFLVKSDSSVNETVEVAAAARLAILLLSEEFFSDTKWPMMELSTFVLKNIAQIDRMRNVKFILPVYFRMSITDLVRTFTYRFDRQSYRPTWYLAWEKWAQVDRRVHLQAWEATWSMIRNHEAVHICIPRGTCDWTRDSQRTIDDDQGRRMIVQKVLSDPKLGFATGCTSIPGFVNARASAHPAPKHFHAMAGASQQVQGMLRASQQVHALPVAQAQHEEQIKSTPPSGWSHAPVPPAPSAIPAARPGLRMNSLFEAAALQLQLSAAVIPGPPVPPVPAWPLSPRPISAAVISGPPVPPVPAWPPSPRPIIPERLVGKPLFKGECSKTFECGDGDKDDDQGRDSRDEEGNSDDEEDDEQNGHASDEESHEDSEGSQESEDSEYVPPEDIEEHETGDNDEPYASDDDDDNEDYDEDSGSDGDYSG